MCFFGLDVFRCSQGWGSARVWALTKASHPRAHNPNRGTMSEEWGSEGGWSPTVMLRRRMESYSDAQQFPTWPHRSDAIPLVASPVERAPHCGRSLCPKSLGLPLLLPGVGMELRKV